MGTKQQVSSHLQACPFYEIICLVCHLSIVRKDSCDHFHQHRQEIIFPEYIGCENWADGCWFWGPVQNLDEHRKTCEKSEFTCLLCSRSVNIRGIVCDRDDCSAIYQSRLPIHHPIVKKNVVERVEPPPNSNLSTASTSPLFKKSLGGNFTHQLGDSRMKLLKNSQKASAINTTIVESTMATPLNHQDIARMRRELKVFSIQRPLSSLHQK
jgi:hypothetical protein